MITFIVNKRRLKYKGPPFKRLLDVLREDFELTGTKEGCGEGECGACSVLMDGQLVNACLIPAGQAEGKTIETVESLAKHKTLAPVQKAFLDHGGSQCGMCTPGMLLSAVAYKRRKGKNSAAAIRKHLAGNLCRCTGYQPIIDSVRAWLKKS
ncbi:MAG: (2Fe-2S)-binding protein [Elusimicrobiota bacterium]